MIPSQRLATKRLIPSTSSCSYTCTLTSLSRLSQSYPYYPSRSLLSTTRYSRTSIRSISSSLSSSFNLNLNLNPSGSGSGSRSASRSTRSTINRAYSISLISFSPPPPSTTIKNNSIRLSNRPFSTSLTSHQPRKPRIGPYAEAATDQDQDQDQDQQSQAEQEHVDKSENNESDSNSDSNSLGEGKSDHHDSQSTIQVGGEQQNRNEKEQSQVDMSEEKRDEKEREKAREIKVEKDSVESGKDTTRSVLAAGANSNSSTNSSSSSSSSSGSSSGSSSSSNSLTRQTVPTNYPQVLALPITRRPLFPGFYKAVVIKNPSVCSAIKESMKRGQPYVGAFLLRNEQDDSDVIDDLEKVHRVGVFCQITNVFPVQKSSTGGSGTNSNKKEEESATGTGTGIGNSQQGKDKEKEKGKQQDDEEEEGLTAVLYPHRRISIDELISPNGHVKPWPPSLDTPTPPVPVSVTITESNQADTNAVPVPESESASSSSSSTSTPSLTSNDATLNTSGNQGTTAESKVVKKEKIGEIIREAKQDGIIPNENDSNVDKDSDDVISSSSITSTSTSTSTSSSIPNPNSNSNSPHSHSVAPFQTSFLQDYAVSLVNVSNLSTLPYNKEGAIIRAVKSELISVFKDIATLNPLFRDQITNFGISQGAGNVFDEPDKLADFAAAVSSGEVGELQDVLESLDVEERLQKSLLVLKKELINAELQSKISKDVESKIQKRQREYFLMEQLKGIKKELGMESDGKDKLIEKFKEKANTLSMPEAVSKVFEEELNKLQGLEPSASEFNVTRGYLDWLTNIPWGVNSTENYSISNAKKILDSDHFGLKDVKDRILEFLAIGKLKGKVEGKILCLVGPPGVGKTSIGKSIASAIERKFFRFSVGGLSDVAEIKGHRRTYVGAMPGKSIQALKKVKVENPLILIDEVDKIGRGHNGDPSSALLEMLDPEQNESFLDHYMDVPVNLSRVLFVCTANSLDTIPQPLLDRMEVIEVSSYTADEKKNIAKDYLAPQAKEASGLKDTDIKLPDETIEFLIRYHSRESGVRGLRKLFEKIYRKIAFEIVRDYGEDVFPEPPRKVESVTQDKDQDQQEKESVAGAVNSDTQSVTPPPTPDSPSSASDSPSPSSSSSSSSPSSSESLSTTTTERQPLSVPSSVSKTISIQSLKKYLGPPSYSKDRMFSKGSTPEGVSIGLGYLGNGSGSLMPIETALIPSKNGGGSLKLTGKLGDVIKESANVALSWMKSNVKDLGIASIDNDRSKTGSEEEKGKGSNSDSGSDSEPHSGSGSPSSPTSSPLSRNEIHLHMPEGAIGKEGPSAGVAFVTSLVSLLTQKRLPSDLAMTGEVSLRGLVLPVGGLKEKLLAAHRAGITQVILPAQNQANVESDVPQIVLDALEIHYVHNVWSALNVAFGEGPWSTKAREMEEIEQRESREDKMRLQMQQGEEENQGQGDEKEKK